MNRRNKLIFAILYLAYTSIYIARINLSMAGPGLIEAGIMDTVQLGLLGSVFSTVFAVGRLINGGLSDRTPPWMMLTSGLLVAGLSNIAIGFLPPFIGIFFLWTANAYAQSMLWSSVLCAVSGMYEKSVAKQKTAIMVTSVATGNILSIIINTFLITKFGVNFAFVIPGLLTVVLGFAVLKTTRHIRMAEDTQKEHKSMLELFKNKEMVMMLIPAMFHGVMKENISLWMTVYIVDTYLVDLSTSSYYILLIPIIGFIGRTLYSLAYKLCNNKEHSVSLAGFVVCILASVLLCLGKVGIITSVLSMSFIYAAVSMINTSILSIYPLRYTKSGNVASVSGIMDFATYLGGGIASVIYGVVIKSYGYVPMFVSWIVISVISIIMTIKINKNKV